MRRVRVVMPVGGRMAGWRQQQLRRGLVKLPSRGFLEGRVLEGGGGEEKVGRGREGIERRRDREGYWGRAGSK